MMLWGDQSYNFDVDDLCSSEQISQILILLRNVTASIALSMTILLGNDLSLPLNGTFWKP